MSCRKNMQQVNLRQLRFTVAEFGTVVRTGNGKLVGVFATDEEAYEAIVSLSTNEMEES